MTPGTIHEYVVAEFERKLNHVVRRLPEATNHIAPFGPCS